LWVIIKAEKHLRPRPAPLLFEGYSLPGIYSRCGANTSYQAAVPSREVGTIQKAQFLFGGKGQRFRLRRGSKYGDSWPFRILSYFYSCKELVGAAHHGYHPLIPIHFRAVSPAAFVLPVPLIGMLTRPAPSGLNTCSPSLTGSWVRRKTSRNISTTSGSPQGSLYGFVGEAVFYTHFLHKRAPTSPSAVRFETPKYCCISIASS
jgi:hypothetical protein